MSEQGGKHVIVTNGRPSRVHGTIEDVERGLWAVAYAKGNTYRAARDLANEGRPIGRSTLDLWKREMYPARYAEIEREVMVLVQRQVQKEMERLVRLNVRKTVRDAVTASAA